MPNEWSSPDELKMRLSGAGCAQNTKELSQEKLTYAEKKHPRDQDNGCVNYIGDIEHGSIRAVNGVEEVQPFACDDESLPKKPKQSFDQSL